MRKALLLAAAILAAGHASAQSYGAATTLPYAASPQASNSSYQTLFGTSAGPNINPVAIGAVCVGNLTCGGSASQEAYLVGGGLSVSLATLKTYSGTLAIVVDGFPWSASVNLSGATSFANAAQIISAALPSAIVAYWDAANSCFVLVDALGIPPTTIAAATTNAFTTNLKIESGTLQYISNASGGLGGINNTIGGGSAGTFLFSGTDNTFYGYNAGYADNVGSYNTLYGSGAGSAITTGNNNVLLGSHAGQSLTTGANEIIIGSANPAAALASIDASSPSAVNEINIGRAYVNMQALPVIASGFGTSPSVATGSGSHVFTFTEGSSPGAGPGVVTMPASPLGTGWICFANDMTHTTVTARESATTATSATFTFSATPTAADVFQFMCDAY